MIIDDKLQKPFPSLLNWLILQIIFPFASASGLLGTPLPLSYPDSVGLSGHAIWHMPKPSLGLVLVYVSSNAGLVTCFSLD